MVCLFIGNWVRWNCDGFCDTRVCVMADTSTVQNRGGSIATIILI